MIKKFYLFSLKLIRLLASNKVALFFLYCIMKKKFRVCESSILNKPQHLVNQSALNSLSGIKHEKFCEFIQRVSS